MNRPARPLENQTAVVTGASSGIGRAIALELAAAGAHVVIHGRRSRETADVVAAEACARGVEATAILADLCVPDQVDELVDLAWQWRGRIDIWVNNAGADILTGRMQRLSFEAKLEALWKTDVLAAVRLSRLAGSRMKAAGGGAIVHVGWDGADRGMAGDSGELFALIKGAIMAFSRSLAQSLAPEVRVNCVAPGWIRTSWGEQAPEEWQSRARRESLLGRWGTPEDVARVVRFLVSPEAAFLNGQTLPVNGGFRYGPLPGQERESEVR